MNTISRKDLALAGIALGLFGFAACTATHLSDVTKDSTYDAGRMHRVFVVAVVKTDRIQKMLEDEFVKQLNENGRQASASYTYVPHENKMEPDAWKSLLAANGFDTVVVSRLLDMKVVEKEMGAKMIAVGNPGSGYGYYGSAYGSVYQPGSYVREQTAMVETKIFDVASAKEVWSARSKTEIAWGGDPVPQMRTFVKTLIREARR